MDEHEARKALLGFQQMVINELEVADTKLLQHKGRARLQFTDMSKTYIADVANGRLRLRLTVGGQYASAALNSPEEQRAALLRLAAIRP